MPPLSATARARLSDNAFAYIDSQGRRRLPINDISHVRNALARFDQVDFEDDDARERARERLLRAAKKHGIVPLGFFDGQLRKASGAIVRSLPRGTVTFLLTDIEGSTRILERLGDDHAGLLRDVRTTIRTIVRASSGHQVDARAHEFFPGFRRSRATAHAPLASHAALHGPPTSDDRTPAEPATGSRLTHEERPRDDRAEEHHDHDDRQHKRGDREPGRPSRRRSSPRTEQLPRPDRVLFAYEDAYRIYPRGTPDGPGRFERSRSQSGMNAVLVQHRDGELGRWLIRGPFDGHLRHG